MQLTRLDTKTLIHPQQTRCVHVTICRIFVWRKTTNWHHCHVPKVPLKVETLDDLYALSEEIGVSTEDIHLAIKT